MRGEECERKKERREGVKITIGGNTKERCEMKEAVESKERKKKKKSNTAEVCSRFEWMDDLHAHFPWDGQEIACMASCYYCGAIFEFCCPNSPLRCQALVITQDYQFDLLLLPTNAPMHPCNHVRVMKMDLGALSLFQNSSGIGVARDIRKGARSTRSLISPELQRELSQHKPPVLDILHSVLASRLPLENPFLQLLLGQQMPSFVQQSHPLCETSG